MHMHSNSERALLAIIYISSTLILFLPFLFLPQTLYPFVFGKMIFFQIFVEVATAAWLLLALFFREYRPCVKNVVLLTLTLYIGALIATMATGVDPVRSFWYSQERMTGVLGFIHAWLWVIVLSSVIKKRIAWDILIFISLSASVAIAIVGFAVQVFTDGLLEATFGNQIFFAAYAGLHVFLALFLFPFQKDVIIRIFLMTSLVLNGTLILFIGSRGAFFSLLASCALYALFVYYTVGRRGRTIYLSLTWVVCALALVGIIFFITPAGRPIAERYLPLSLARTFFSSGSGIPDRLALWNIGLEGFRERPLLGWGWGNFRAVYEKHFDVRSYMGAWYDDAHNHIIDVLALTGIVGAFFYILFWIALIGASVRLYVRAETRAEKYATAALAPFFVFYFIQNLTIFDSPAPLFVFFLGVALLVFLSRSHDGSIVTAHDRPRKRGTPLPFILCLVIVSSACAASIYYINIIAFQKSMLGVRAYLDFYKKPRQAVSDIYSALDRKWFTNQELLVQFDHITSAEPFFLDSPLISRDEKVALMRFLIEKIEQEIVGPPHGNKIQMYTKAMLLYEKLYRFEHDERPLLRAQEIFELAKSASPRRWHVYYHGARISLLLGRTDEAIQRLQQGAAYTPEIIKGDHYWQLVRVYLTKRDLGAVYGALVEAEKQGYEIYDDTTIALSLARSLPDKQVPLWAMVYIDRVAIINPHDLSVVAAQVVAYTKTGKTKEAEGIIKKIEAQDKSVLNVFKALIQESQSSSNPILQY